MDKLKYLNDALTEDEAIGLIERYPPASLEEFSSADTIRRQAILERLTMQSVKNALGGSEDFIMTAFVSQEDKYAAFIKDIFVIKAWKRAILPKIKDKITAVSDLKLYICLHQEAVLLNLLEHFFFQVTAVEKCGTQLVDIIDYCYENVSWVLGEKRSFSKMSNAESLDEKSDYIRFCVGMSSITVLKYIIDHVEALEFPVKHNLINVKDINLLFVELMERKPWLDEENGLVYENNRWVKVSQAFSALPKIEAQIWMGLFMSLQDPKYEITEFRKGILLRLRKFMNDSLFDKMPPLKELLRKLEELSMTAVGSSATSNTFVIELVPTLYKEILEGVDASAVAEACLSSHWKSKEQCTSDLKVLTDVYSTEYLEYFMDDPKCGNCGDEAASRCSKCKSEWYCSRDCQIARWKDHKPMCTKLAELNIS